MKTNSSETCKLQANWPNTTRAPIGLNSVIYHGNKQDWCNHIVPTACNVTKKDSIAITENRHTLKSAYWVGPQLRYYLFSPLCQFLHNRKDKNDISEWDSVIGLRLDTIIEQLCHDLIFNQTIDFSIGAIAEQSKRVWRHHQVNPIQCNKCF